MKRICILCAIAFASAPAMAAVTVFSGNDPGAEASSPRPNSDAAAAAFDLAAASLGPETLITFESLNAGQFASRNVAPGVTATQTNFDSTLGGIVTNSYVSPSGAPYGYNTTSGGTKFLAFVPIADIQTARMDFFYTTPIQAWGAYIVGLEPTVAGSVAVQFSDGATFSQTLAETTPAGPQFFGFTDPGKSITQISLIETGISGSRDIWGIDDVRSVAVPEPSAIVSALAVLTTFSTRRRRPILQNRV